MKVTERVKVDCALEQKHGLCREVTVSTSLTVLSQLEN